MATLIFADDVGEASGGRETCLDGDLPGLGVALRFVFHADKGEPPRARIGRNEGDKSGFLAAVTAFQFVRDEIAERGAGAFQFPRFGGVNNQHVGEFTVGGFVSAKSRTTADVRRKGIGHGHRRGFGFIEAVQEFFNKVMEASLVESLRKSFGDECASLFRLHGGSQGMTKG